MKKIGYFLLLLLAAGGCIQKFQPSLSSPPTGYLVVEGIINGAGGPATVILSRTNKISNASVLYETGATVQVEGNDNSVYSFSENGNGFYGTDLLGLTSALQYRLRIKTTEGKEYLSDFAAMKTTPPIDSIEWQIAKSGVQIYANTHDPLNNTLYYKWDYEETWEYHSPFIKEMNYDTVINANGNPQLSVVVSQNADLSIYTCWQTALSTEILLGSSARLSNDVIADFPVAFIPPASVKLGVEYSILVKQYALTVDAYNFLEVMKKNTEETGSIFGSQPSELHGNIHCVSNPAETVVGYVGFCSVEGKRIFINNSQLPSWGAYDWGCTQDSILNDPNLVKAAFIGDLLPTTPLEVNRASGVVIRFLAAPASCVDCTLSGSNQKPSFWQ